MKKPTNHSISRETILDTIAGLLQDVMQWSANPEWASNVVEHYEKATALIELLEVDDCGSIGGHDKNQPRASNIFDRWDWLYRKYDNPDKKRIIMFILYCT